MSFSKNFLEYQILYRQHNIVQREIHSNKNKDISTRYGMLPCAHALRSTIHELQFAGLDYRKPFSFPFFFASRRKHRFTEWLGLTISQKLFLKFHSFLSFSCFGIFTICLFSIYQDLKILKLKIRNWFQPIVNTSDTVHTKQLPFYPPTN